MWGPGRAALALLLGGCSLAAGAAETYEVPRLPWGEPDLQGIWTNATLTTLERPEEIDGLVLSEAQAAALEQHGEEVLARIDDLGEGDLESGADVGGYNSFWMDPGTRVLRVRGEPRSSIITEPEDGEVPYSLRGMLRFAWQGYKFLYRHDNPEERPLGERCVVGFGSTGGPPMLPVLYNNHYQIVQTPGQVLVLVEMNHNVRTIRIGAQPLPPVIRPWLGDSIGYWEGDTLVVRTTQFHPQQNLRAAIKHRLYMTSDSVVEERFTRIGDTAILYQFTVTDDSIYRQAWSGELTLRASEGPIYEYACHEGNYALSNILSGARQEEQD
jgi:hypothetical protein